MALTIGRCSGADIDAVVRFIDTHWKRSHALVVSRRLLDWQYRNPDGSYSFVVARRDREVLGIVGYIATRRFDAGLADDNVIWLTTWKVRDDAGVAGLGLALLQRVAAEEPHVAIGAIGFNPGTRPIYEALGFRVGELQHYVMANRAMRPLMLASISETIPTPTPGTRRLTARPLTQGEEFDRLSRDMAQTTAVVPRKTVRYFHGRYVCHPVYTYRVLALDDGAAVVGLLAARTAEHEGRRALRIVDFAGPPDMLARIGDVVEELVRAEAAEYADVYNAGIDSRLFAEAGFVRIDPDGNDIVPDHFEPFDRRNVRLWFSLKGGGSAVLFKGDADQDRPNLVTPDVR
jgi:hypothetical protein